MNKERPSSSYPPHKVSDDIAWLNRQVSTNPDSPSPDRLTTISSIILDSLGEPITETNRDIVLEFLKKQMKVPAYEKLPDSGKRRLQKQIKKELHRHRASLKGEDRPYLDALGKASQFDLAMKPMEHAKNLDPDVLSKEHQDDILAIADRFNHGFEMERPQGTSFHHFFDFLSKEGHPSYLADFFKREFQSFVVEHDWAKAFEGVRDFEGGDIRLPFEYTCFEFRLSGLRVLVFLGEGDAGIEGVLATGINKRWYVQNHKVVFKDGKLSHHDLPRDIIMQQATSFLEELEKQIRAICIMLDAKVAVAEKRSMGGAGLNKRRIANNQPPLRDYHVVTLAKRLRAEAHEGEETGIRHRLHWRRGHWRHFESPGGQIRYINAEGITVSKTWINWQLVGDERLGFVDKHYRL